MKNTPSITSKQQEILKLLYKYRFLNRPQIQALLTHKDKRRITAWLKDLREKQYIAWQYNPNDFVTKAKPATYYLSLNGIRYLRNLDNYSTGELRKRYKESSRSQAFIDQCLFIADSCLALQSKSDESQQYVCVTPAEYVDSTSEYHYLSELKPHLLFSKHQGKTMSNYLLENVALSLPRYQLRKRLKDYVEYLANEWSEANGPLPVALFVCSTTADLMYVKRRIKLLLDDLSNNEDVRVRVTTIGKVQAIGVASMIWEEI